MAVRTAAEDRGSVPADGDVFVPGQPADGLQRAWLGNPRAPGRQVFADPAARLMELKKRRFGRRFAKEVGMGNPAEETIRHPNHCKFTLLAQNVNRENAKRCSLTQWVRGL